MIKFPSSLPEINVFSFWNYRHVIFYEWPFNMWIFSHKGIGLHIKIYLSLPPDASMRDDWSYFRTFMPYVWPSSVYISLNSLFSHIFIFASSEPVAILFFSKNSSTFIVSSWALHVVLSAQMDGLLETNLLVSLNWSDKSYYFAVWFGY